MRFLRQSTASQEILLGPFVAAADGTPQTGLTIANTDIKLLPGGATSESNKNSGGGTHIAGGRYSAVLDATDTATVGILEVSVNPASGIPFNKSYYVLEEAVYDAMFAASAVGPLLASADGSTLTAINLPNQTMDIVGNITGNLSGSVGSVTGAVGSVTGAVGSVTGDIGGIAPNGLTLDAIATDARQAFGLNASGTLSGTHSDTTADLGTSAPTEDVTGQTLYFPVHQLSRVITSYNTGTGVATFDSIGVTLANANVWHLSATAPLSGGGGGGDATEAKQDAIIALIGTPAVDLATDIGTRASQTSVNTIDDLLDTEVGALTTELAKVPKSDGTASWNATAAAQIQQEATDALNAYDPPTNAELTAAVGNVSVDEIQATALADLFNTDSATTYASAVAGSVVKEIADNAGGSALTTDAIAEAMFTYNATATYGTADAGSVVKQIADNAGGSALTVEAIRAEMDANSTQLAAIVADTNELQTDWANGGRLDLILDARASQTSVDDLPTNAELATALGTADDAVLAAIAALNNLSSAQAQTAAAAALTAYDPPTRTEATSDANSILTAVGDVPTNAELATALASADDAVLAAIAALNNVSVANILAATVEGSTTLVQSLRLLNAALGGKASGLETTTVHYRDLSDAKDRILAAVDADGNRTAVTLDLT